MAKTPSKETRRLRKQADLLEALGDNEANEANRIASWAPEASRYLMARANGIRAAAKIVHREGYGY